MKELKFKLGDEVKIGPEAHYINEQIGRIRTVSKNKINNKVALSTYTHGPYYFTDGYGELWICLGDRNCMQKHLLGCTKLEKLLY